MLEDAITAALDEKDERYENAIKDVGWIETQWRRSMDDNKSLKGEISRLKAQLEDLGKLHHTKAIGAESKPHT